ncbi:MAG: class I SAM-dependent methyltransferase [Acidobacteria bacterium]|nr:MAG: class I SAM-dependent methyltransferase [Acidobacteriota bacterium]
MASPESPAIRNVSDTALWVAMYRALESERPDAHFRDPYARALAGERGARIAAQQTEATKHSWSFVARTVLADRLIAEHLAAGADMVINLAAGLDTRPYRLDLPATLRWIEVDLPPLLDYKESILGNATPRCQLQRVRCDLADASARQALFAMLSREAKRVLILTEGLLIYFPPDAVASLARDLAACASFHDWVIDLGSPGLLRMMQKTMPAGAGAVFRFAPAEGPEFFRPAGWRAASVHPIIRAGLQLHRLPNWPLRLAAIMPQTHPGNGRRPWSAVCHLTR